MGVGRPVMYFFVRSEQFSSLTTLFTLFKDIMGPHHSVKTVIMDKMLAQMRAAYVTLDCDIILCYFHIRQAIRKHVTLSFTNFEMLQASTGLSRSIFHRMATLDNATQ